MAKNRIKQSQRKKQKHEKPELKLMPEYGGFIGGESFEIKNGDPDYEFMSGLWDAIKKDVEDSENNQAT